MVINRWLILGVLFVARFALGFQFQSAGSATPFVVEDFGVDYTNIGLLVGLYILPGLFLSVPAGFAGRRFGDKRIVLAGLMLMLAGGAVAGAAERYATVVVGRLMSGAGAALLSVLLTKMLTDWFAGAGLFGAMSIFMIGWPSGIAAGQALQTPIALASSWHGIFYLTALGSAAAFLSVAVFYRAPGEPAERPAGASRSVNRRELWLVTIAGIAWMFINGAYFVLVSFAPTFLAEQGASFEDASGIVSLMSWVFIVSMPLGGTLATRFQAPNVVMFTGLIGTIIVGGLMPFTDLALVTFLLFGVCYAVSAPVVASLPAEVLRAANRGPGFGMYYLWYFAGSALLPVAAGSLTDLTGTAASAVLFGVAMMLATLVLVILFRVAQARFPAPAEQGGARTI